MFNVTYHMTTEYDRQFDMKCGYAGEVIASYLRLVELFGLPNRDPDYEKVRVVWQVTFDIGGSPLFISIFDWKQFDTRVPDVVDWTYHSDNPEAARAWLQTFINTAK